MVGAVSHAALARVAAHTATKELACVFRSARARSCAARRATTAIPEAGASKTETPWTTAIDTLDALPTSLSEAVLVVGATASRAPIVDVDTVRAAMCARAGRPLFLLHVPMTPGAGEQDFETDQPGRTARDRQHARRR